MKQRPLMPLKRVRKAAQAYPRPLCLNAGCPLIRLIGRAILKKKPYWDKRGRFRGCPENWPEQWWDAWHEWWLA